MKLVYRLKLKWGKDLPGAVEKIIRVKYDLIY